MSISVAHIMFFVMAAVTIVSAIAVIAGRNLFHAVSFLGVFMLHIAGFYFMLNAELAAMMQVFVYVGGVVVVLLFGIMLTSRMTDVRWVSAMERPWLTIAQAIGLVAILVFIIAKTHFNVSSVLPADDSASLIGHLFLTDYILPFEVISVLLLAALIGAVIIARQEDRQ